MATVTWPIPGYPTVVLTEDRRQISVRPMEAKDEGALLAFFQRVPEEDLRYLKEDVVSPGVIHGWAEDLDYRRVIPLLALAGDRVIADATLHRRRQVARRHVGEVRVVVDPEFRNRGLGRNLLLKLVEVAGTLGLKKVLFEVVAEREEPARKAAQLLGFAPVGVFPGHICDRDGSLHDLIVMEVNVSGLIAADEWGFF